MKDKEELLKRVNKRGETALDVALANEETGPMADDANTTT